MPRSHQSQVQRWLIEMWDTTAMAILDFWDRIPSVSHRSPKFPGAKAVRSTSASVRLRICPRRQWVSFSCTASCLQMVWEFFTGKKLSHYEAVRLMRCRPDGAPLERIASVVRKRIRCRSKPLRSPSQIRKALKGNAPVLASDDLSHTFAHAILISGCTPKGFYIIDPLDGSCRWRRDRKIFEGSDEFIAIFAN